MTKMRTLPLLPASILVFALTFAAACGSGASETVKVPVGPTGVSGPAGSGNVTLSTPAALSPVNGEQLTTLRPTLTVQNATSSQQSGSRTYEFQVSDRTDFTMGASLTASFLVTVNQTGVPEGGDGRTSFTVGQDLQPTTRMFWRARVLQGTTNSSWSDPASFRTKVGGYNRPGELYDPLVSGESIGEIRGAHTFVAGKGLRLDTERSYVQYPLGSVLTSGEISVEVEGLRPNGPNHKLKIFSMNDSPGDITNSSMGMATMYRGINGNPPNAISYKAVFNGRILEPNRGIRDASVMSLDPARTYFWKATWDTGFRLLVADGGVNGNVIYDRGESANGGYRPSYAFLGSNQGVSGLDAGTFPGATFRHLWISDKPRPTTLGNALE
jgi:hypothetical protein